MRTFFRFILLLTLCASVTLLDATAQEATAKKKKKANRQAKQSAISLHKSSPFAELNSPKVHEDFPAMCLNGDGQPVVVYIENNGEADTLMLARLGENGKLVPVAPVSDPEIDNIYQPCLTQLPSGRVLCVWSQLGADGQWDLMARTIGRKGKAVMGEAAHLTTGSGNDIFADLDTDRQGRVWLTWQRLENGVNRVVARHLDPKSNEWSKEIQVTDGATGGDWEPRLASGGNEEALIVFDSYRNGNFDVFLTQVSPDGTVSPAITVADSERYEARAEAAVSADGKHLWITYEDGMKLWGKDLGADWRKKRWGPSS